MGKEVRDDSLWENVCGNILIDGGITRGRTERKRRGGEGRGSSCVTCGAERDEGLRVLADHPQLIFGEGQPSYDVFHKVIGGDGRHVPLQLPQHDQLPVLEEDDE